MASSFSKFELRDAGVGKTETKPIGIAIDYRRTNKTLDGLQANFERLKKSELILFPKKLSALKKGESSPEEPNVAAQLRDALMPVKSVVEHEAPRAVTEAEKKVEIYRLIRRVCADKRFARKRERKAHLAATADK